MPFEDPVGVRGFKPALDYFWHVIWSWYDKTSKAKPLTVDDSFLDPKLHCCTGLHGNGADFGRDLQDSLYL